MGRGRSRLRDLPLIGWLVAAVVIAGIHRWLPDANWLMLHLVLLGALTHSILVWSFHFAQTLLRAPATERRPHRAPRRLGLLTGGRRRRAGRGADHLVAADPRRRDRCRDRGRMARSGPVAHAAQGAAGTVPGHRPLLPVRLLRRWCCGRDFGSDARLGLAGPVARTAAGGPRAGQRARLGRSHPHRHAPDVVAHHAAHPAMDATAERWTRTGTAGAGRAIAVAIGGALVGIGLVAALGVLGLPRRAAALGTGPVASGADRAYRASSPRRPSRSVWSGSSSAWSGPAGCLPTAPDWTQIREGFGYPAAVARRRLRRPGAHRCAVLPVAVRARRRTERRSRGPSLVRPGRGAFRLVAINGGLVLWLLPSPSWVKVTGSLLALIAAASFLPLLILGVRASITARAAASRPSQEHADARTAVPAGGAPMP